MQIFYLHMVEQVSRRIRLARKVWQRITLAKINLYCYTHPLVPYGMAWRRREIASERAALNINS